MKVIFILFTLFLIACQGNKNVFNGEFKEIKGRAPVIELQEEPVGVEVMNCTKMVIVDTFAVVYNLLYDDHLLSVYGVKDWHYYGRYVPQGRGPDECQYITFYSENQEKGAKLWLWESPEMKVWDVAKSVAEQKTVFDRKWTFSNIHVANVENWYRINDSLFLGGRNTSG